MRGTISAAAGAALAVQVIPAATWLPPLRRLIPPLESPMLPGTVAVTFDDGPDPEGTPAVLDALDDLGWVATFFMLGCAVERFPDVAHEVVRRGHAVGVHGYEHKFLLVRTPIATRQDLARATHIIAAATGVTPRWWRPPYGVLTTSSLWAAAPLRLRPVLWSAWGKEWRAGATTQQVSATVSAGRLDGGTILLHDSDLTSAAGTWRRTAQALPLIAQRLRAAGLQVAALN